jgi:hypothetical protein
MIASGLPFATFVKPEAFLQEQHQCVQSSNKAYNIYAQGLLPNNLQYKPENNIFVRDGASRGTATTSI